MSLQVWLPLNGSLKNQGLADIAVINNNATINNNGKIGQCYSFNGTDNYLVFNNLTCSNWATFSLTCWCYPSSDFNYLFLIRGGGAHRVRISGDGFMFRDSNNSTQRIVGFGTTIPLNTWSHIACIYNRGEIFMYVNGVLTNHSTTYYHNNSTFLSDHNEVRLARQQSSSGNSYYNGKINDVRIYDHCLSDKEVAEIAKGLVLHYKLDGPNENLLSLTPKSHDATAYNAYQFNMTSNLVANETYTVQFWDVDVYHSAKTAAQTGVWIYWGGGYVNLLNWAGPTYFTADGSTNYHADYLVKTFTVTSANASGNGATNAWLNIYNSVGNANGTRNMHIGKWKLEKGSIATPYADDVVNVYDVSGYHNDGIKNNISILSDTVRYTTSSKFSGSTSYIKVSDNGWLAQHAPEMTLNMWVKNTAFTNINYAKFFSCTETGGFNVEAGNSGYLRFPIYVCTNAAQSSYAYKYDSQEIQLSALTANEWNMITLVYNNTGTKTYINGVLHHTYTNTSYGIRFNVNARLFLGCEANTASPTTPYYNGQMSDFRLYYTALTEEQVLDLYHTSGAIDKSGNVYGREYFEIDKTSITKTGQIQMAKIYDSNDLTKASILKNEKQIQGYTLYEY